MTAPPPVAGTQDVCASDPNFAVIFAFCERFGDSCGVTIPTFQELQEMLEKTDEVPEALINLHVKLLRKSKKIVYLDKWEKAIIKFCQGYSVPECWKLEHYGYKGISVELKLRILKALIEVQFDLNVKFKAEINKYESSTLRSQPLGWDKSGAAYWVQFDRSYNLRVYKDDADEDSWQIVAKDRSTLVNLINELSGFKDTTNDTSANTSPVNENIEECTIKESTDFKSDINIFDPRGYSLEKPINLKRESNEDSSLNKINTPIVGEVIEESVMIVKGEGSGNECDTGNPDETNTQNETLKTEDVKKPKLWSIETICSSSKEVQEDVSVPKTGFFFGDDSVPCFNSVSNGEKFEGGSLKKNNEELTTNTNIDEKPATNVHLDEELTISKNVDEKLGKNKKLDEELAANNKLNEELAPDKKLCEEQETDKKLFEEPATDKKLDKELSTIIKLEEEHSTNKQLNEELTKNNKIDETVDSTMSNRIESLDKECSSKNAENLSIQKTSKQSVFNIKVHEEEVQITERKANEVFTKSESIVKDNAHITKTHGSTTIDPHNKLLESKLGSTIQVFESNSNNKSLNFDETNKLYTEQNKIVDGDEKFECKNNDDQTDGHVTLPNLATNEDIHTVKQESCSVKLPENRKEETEQQFESDPQLITKVEDKAVKLNVHILENNLKTNKQSTSDSNQSNEVKKVTKSCENINPNKSLLNQCIDINEQNSSTLDKTPISNEVNLSGITDNQILTNECNIIDNNEEIVNLEVQSNESNKQLPENVVENIQTTDDLDNNATNLKSKLNLHTENVNATKILIQCSGENVGSKAHDQTLMDDVNQYPTTSKQIDDDQNYKKPNLTLHSISNIIETDKSVDDSVIGKKQLINTADVEINKSEYCQIKNKNNIQEKTESIVNVAQNISNNKHSLDKILQKSVEIQEIPECPSICKNNSADEFKLKNQPESANIKVEMDNICIVESEKNIKELKTKDLDLTVAKKDSEPILPIEEKSNIELDIPKVQAKGNATIYSINTPESPKFDDEIFSTSIDGKIKPTESEFKHNSKRDKHKTDVSYDGEPKNESHLKDKFATNVSIQKSRLAIETDENNTNEIVQDDKCMSDISIKNDDNLKNKENSEDNINQEHKINKKEKDQIDDNILQTSEVDPSPAYEDVYESAGETNEDTFIESSKDEFDDSEMIDKTIEEDEKISGEDEEIPKKKGKPGRKKGKRGKTKRNITSKQEITSNVEEKVKRPYKPRQKKVVTIAEEVTVFPEPAGDDNVRRSRRIAEIKIKEQFIPTAQYDDIDIPLKISKKKDKGVKKVSTPTKKMETAVESDDDDEEDPISKKHKKRKRKGKPDSLKKINMVNPWNVDSESSSSENNVELFEDYDHEEEEEILRPGIEPNISDHEFSPESDINEDEDYLPEKRARTAHKKDQSEQLKDDMPCQNCKKSDQPEWILLCDTCNQGWHASCLRPPLMVIPDGDWYCPACRHSSLLDSLNEVLKKYDEESKKRENEELRRKRLAYVGISLQNVISSKTEEVKTPKLPVVHDSSSEEESESESYDSEPLYQLRARRQANVSYRFNDYDDMINEAILEETGVDESVAKKSTEVKTDKNDNDEKSDSENDESNKNRNDSPIAPALLHLRGRKKSKKLTNLDISSDDGSDEDFKGPSDGDDDYEEEFSDDSDDSVQKRAQPTRRSVRNRKTVMDPDFINDDSSEDGDKRSNKKRSRPWSESSNSEGEDFTWGKKKKKRSNLPSSSSLSFKLHKGLKRQHNDGQQKSKKYKIKYGMDSDSDSYGQSKRRTRGRQITYAESDESEQEVQTKKRKVASDEEDEYVLNDEELEAENDDHHLEVDEEDAMASNDEKDEDAEEEEEEEEAADEEEDDDEEQEGGESKPAVAQLASVKLLPSAVATMQSVIRELPPLASESTGPPTAAVDYVQQRLMPLAAGATVVRSNVLAPTPPSPVDPIVASDKQRKRPLPHQLNESPSLNPSVDYGSSGGYPYPPDATKVVSSTVVVPPSQPVHQATFSRPPTAAFKAMAALPPPGFPATYRAPNKMSPTAYLSPQVGQVYQSAPPPPQQSRSNYSPYPIDFAATGTPLTTPPPPAIAFRNVVVAPPPSHEHPPVQQLPPGTQQQSVAASGDSEFGGLVSYFSSQQEDDFDT